MAKKDDLLKDLAEATKDGSSRTYPTKKAWDLKNKIIDARYGDAKKEDIQKLTADTKENLPLIKKEYEMSKGMKKIIKDKKKEIKKDLNNMKDGNVWNKADAVQYGQRLNATAWPEYENGRKAVLGNPGELGNFPLYYFCLGHLNMCLKHVNDSSVPDKMKVLNKPDGYLNGYLPWLQNSTVFRVPAEITEALVNTRLPKDLNRHSEIRLPKDNMFIETSLQVVYNPKKRSRYKGDVYGIHIMDADITGLDADMIRNADLFKRIMETCTFDGKKFDTVEKVVEFIGSCGNLRAFKSLHLETTPKTGMYNGEKLKARLQHYPETVQNLHIMWKPEHNVVERLPPAEKLIRDYVFNYILFVNNPEVEYSLRETPVKSNNKRVQKGKLPKPDYAIIKLKGRIKRMIDDNSNMSAGEKKSAHEVRGHWRHFYSDKYVNMKGKRRWIPQHWRGEGYGVARNYDTAED
jgi:hypothetical protein